MPYSPVHLPFDRVRVSKRRSARAEFDQKRGRRSPVSNSDAFDDEVGAALERVLFDHPTRSGNKKSKMRDQRADHLGKEERRTYFASYQ